MGVAEQQALAMSKRGAIVGGLVGQLEWVYLSSFVKVPGGAERSTVRHLIYSYGRNGLIVDVSGAGLRQWMGIPVTLFNRSLPPAKRIWIESSVLFKPFVHALLPKATLSVRGLDVFYRVVDEARVRKDGCLVDISAKLLRPGMGALVATAGQVVTNSEYMKGVIQQCAGVEAVIVPTMVEKITAPKGKKVLFMDSRFWKHSRLIPFLVQKVPSVSFRVVDRGDSLPHLPNMELVKPTDDIDKLYADVGLVICASQVPEGYGRVAREAIDSGRLVLATPAGALREIVPAQDIILAENREQWVNRVRVFADVPLTEVQEKYLRVAKKGISFDQAQDSLLPVSLLDLDLELGAFGQIVVDDVWELSRREQVFGKIKVLLAARGTLIINDWQLFPDQQPAILAQIESLGFKPARSLIDHKLVLRFQDVVEETLREADPPVVLVAVPSEFVGVSSAVSHAEVLSKKVVKVLQFSGEARIDIVEAAKGMRFVLLEGWKRVYEEYLSELEGVSMVGVRFHSSFGQTELGIPQELEAILTLWSRVRSSSNIVFLHPNLREAQTLKRLGVRVLYWPNVVDLRRYPQVAKKEKFVVDLACPFHFRKNIFVQLLATRLAGVPLLLHQAGESKFTSLYRKTATTLGVDHQFSGHLGWSDYINMVAGCSLGLQVSFAESYSYVTVDHFAVGVPCLVSRQVPIFWEMGPTQEMVARLAIEDLDDPQTIAERIKYFQENRSAGEEMGVQCREQLVKYNESRIQVLIQMLEDIKIGGRPWEKSL